MNKQQTIYKYFNQKEKLTLKNKVYFNQVKNILTNSLADDLNDKGDITTNTLVKDNPKTKAVITAKENGILAGLEEILLLTKKYNLKITSYKKDGDKIKTGDKILFMAGGIKNILKTERTILNLLQRMSGIATETNNLIKLVNNKVLICSTRKTPLGLLDKKAVVVGSGGTHRLGLYDWILIKDNHLKISNFNFKISSKFFEIEVKNKKEAVNAIKLNPGAIMFDNMKPKEIKNIIKILSKYKSTIIFEASGGINQKNIIKYSQTGVDIISLGYLTHSVKALDLSLNIL